jgi:hypothetical protein
MAVLSVLVCLSATGDGNVPIQRPDFLDMLVFPAEITVDAQICTGRPWAASRVDFPPIRARDHQRNTGAARYDLAVQRQLAEVAAFLDAQSVEAFESIRSRNVKPFIFIDVWIDQDQFELDLGHKFIQACSRLALPIQLISNDIGMDELEDASTKPQRV